MGIAVLHRSLAPTHLLLRHSLISSIMKCVALAIVLFGAMVAAEAGYGYGHPGYYGHGYGHGYGYGGYYRHFGKRSAEAEPEADASAEASAEPGYGYHGYGHPAYYAHHAYGY